MCLNNLCNNIKVMGSFSKYIINKLEYLNAQLIRIMCSFFLKHPKSIDKTQVKRILIISYLGIGNSIIFMPFIKNLIHFYRETEITIFVNNGLLAEIINKNFDTLDVVIAQPDKMKLIERWNFFYQQRKKHYDLFICNFLGIKKNMVLLALFCGIKYRIGHVFKGIKGKGKFDFLFNFPIPIEKKHELKFNLDLLAPLQIKPIYTEPIFKINDYDFDVAVNFLKQYKINFKFVLQVYSSQGPHKSWRQYKDLAERIAQDYDAIFILVGSANEFDYIENIFANSKVNYVNIAGKYSLFETAAIIEKSHLYIGNDSGLSHISACRGQKTISIFGMSDPQRVQQIGKQVYIIRKNLQCSPCDTLISQNYKTCPHKNCLVTITPENVMKLINELIKK